MNRYVLFVAIACIVAILSLPFLVHGADAVVTGPVDTATQLKQLQGKVVDLEARIAKLEKRPAYITLPGAAPSLHSPEPVPKAWQQREFNGMKYYIVPVEAKQ